MKYINFFLFHVLFFNSSEPKNTTLYLSNIFAGNIFESVAKANPKQNIIISPAAIQMSLLMAYFGSDGPTANELRKTLHINPNVSSLDLLEKLGHLQKQLKNTDLFQLQNGFFISDTHQFQKEFKEVIKRFLDAQMATLSFRTPYNRYAAYNVSRIIEKSTSNYVSDFIKSEQINESTNAFITNAILLRGDWEKAFVIENKHNRMFVVDDKHKYKVKFIWSENIYRFGEFRDLGAKVVEIRYHDIDYSMLILLPNKIDGLREMEKKFVGKDLLELVNNRTKLKRIHLVLPKFRINFGIDLKRSLQEMGLTTMFSAAASFSKLYKPSTSRQCFNSLHSWAGLEVKEQGLLPPSLSHQLAICVALPVCFCENYVFPESYLFAGHFYDVLASEHEHENFVISPVAAYVALILAYYGAKGKTADEIKQALFLVDPSDALLFHTGKFLEKFSANSETHTGIHIYSGIYINNKLYFITKYKIRANRQLHAELKRMEFERPYNLQAAYTINKAIESNTDYKVHNTIDPKTLNKKIESVIVSGVSFRAIWRESFVNADTQNFFVNKNRSYEMQFMKSRNTYKYLNSKAWDARVVEIPLNYSKLNMVILLPNDAGGLKKLEHKLAELDFLSVFDNDSNEECVELLMPKFTVVFGTDLKRYLKKLGVKRMFSKRADFSKLYRRASHHHIGDIRYKAYLKIDEKGSKPAQLTRKDVNCTGMIVEHPFMYVIRYKGYVIISGHIADYAF